MVLADWVLFVALTKTLTNQAKNKADHLKSKLFGYPALYFKVLKILLCNSYAQLYIHIFEKAHVCIMHICTQESQWTNNIALL